jgi:hypothetical protein
MSHFFLVAGGEWISNAMSTHRDFRAEALLPGCCWLSVYAVGCTHPTGEYVHVINYLPSVFIQRRRNDAGASERHSHAGPWRRVEGDELARSAESGRLLAPFGPLAEAAIEHSQGHGVLAFMARELPLWQEPGQFFGP